MAMEKHFFLLWRMPMSTKYNHTSSKNLNSGNWERASQEVDPSFKICKSC